MRMLTAAEFLRQRAGELLPEVRPDVREAVERIIASVRKNGDTSLRELTATLDGVTLKDFRVPKTEWEKAWKKTPEDVKRALQTTARNIRKYQSTLRPKGKQRFSPVPGVVVTTEWKPLPAVACYAPGGRAPYPSTVLMTAATARVAAVDRVYVVSPPQRDARPSPLVLAAAHVAEADEVYALGGAQAVAAFAYGTDTIPRVAKFVGPGNAYVTEAKRQLFGTVGIEALAGPTELAIFADESADPELVAIDLAAQAEHDPDARTLLVVGSPDQARRIQTATTALVEVAGRRPVLSASLLQNGLIVIASGDPQIVEVLDAYAPEHVELLCRRPERIADRLRCAGTIFLGASTPAPLGDYATGANHVLPTGRTARWASPLSVYDFLRQVVQQKADAKGLQALSETVAILATAENLPMHAETVRRRAK